MGGGCRRAGQHHHLVCHRYRLHDGQYEQRVKPYLAAAKAALQGKYRIGVYACGMVCRRALDENLVDATWLTQSMGFNESRAYRDSRRWRLLRGPETTLAGLS